MLPTAAAATLSRLCSSSTSSRAALCTSSVRGLKKIQEVQDGNVTRVSVVDIPEEPRKRKFIKRHESGCTLCTCDVPIKISYRDVLILEQFMRVDGTVLPRELTGLCKKQQQIIERCVMQAHWAGLFPDRTDPTLDLSGYRRFKRYWKDDMDMYRLKLKEIDAPWYYIKRYNPKTGGFAKPLPPPVHIHED